MKKITLLFASILFATSIGLAAPAHDGHQHGTKTVTENAREKSIVGYISDNHCGLKHMEGMGDDKSCTLMCVKNGKFVLADRDRKIVYKLDKSGQAKAREFAGQKVKVTGHLTGKTIHVTTIVAA